MTPRTTFLSTMTRTCSSYGNKVIVGLLLGNDINRELTRYIVL